MSKTQLIYYLLLWFWPPCTYHTLLVTGIPCFEVTCWSHSRGSKCQRAVFPGITQRRSFTLQKECDLRYSLIWMPSKMFKIIHCKQCSVRSYCTCWHTQYVKLRQPLCDFDVLRLARQSVSFPLPENSLWHLREGLQERVSLVVRECVCLYHGTQVKVDNSMFGSIKVVFNILQ